MQYDQEKIGSVIVVRIKEKRLTSHEAPEMKTAFLALMEVEGEEYVINLKDVEYMDSTGLGAFLFGIRQAERYDKEIIFCELSPRIQSLVRIAQLEKIIEIFEKEEDAIKEYTDEEEAE